LAAHLGDGDPASWRAALRVFEQAFGRPVEVVEEEDDPALLDPFRVSEMTPAQRAQLVARVLERYPHLLPLAPPDLLLGTRERVDGAA
jgi:hypothetical protein